MKTLIAVSVLSLANMSIAQRFGDIRSVSTVPDMTYDRISPAIISTNSNATFVTSFWIEDADTYKKWIRSPDGSGIWEEFITDFSGQTYDTTDANGNSTIRSGGIVNSDVTHPSTRRNNFDVYIQAHTASFDREFWDEYKPVDPNVDTVVRDTPTGKFEFLVKVAKQ